MQLFVSQRNTQYLHWERVQFCLALTSDIYIQGCMVTRLGEIVYLLWAVTWKLRKYPTHLGYFIPWLSSNINLAKKLLGLHFGRLFHILNWSPCLHNKCFFVVCTTPSVVRHENHLLFKQPLNHLQFLKAGGTQVCRFYGLLSRNQLFWRFLAILRTLDSALVFLFKTNCVAVLL
jgi:hypothetical protein